MYSEGELYATMNMSFFGAELSGKRSLEIIPNKKVFPSTYSVMDDSGAATAVLDFGSLKNFPIGSITIDSNTTFALVRDDHSLRLKYHDRDLIFFETMKKGYFSIPSLKVTTYEEAERHDTFDSLLFLGWYAMVGTVMGLEDG